jgi:hypothetical protein
MVQPRRRDLRTLHRPFWVTVAGILSLGGCVDLTRPPGLDDCPDGRCQVVVPPPRDGARAENADGSVPQDVPPVEDAVPAADAPDAGDTAVDGLADGSAADVQVDGTTPPPTLAQRERPHLPDRRSAFR